MYLGKDSRLGNEAGQHEEYLDGLPQEIADYIERYRVDEMPAFGAQVNERGTDILKVVIHLHLSNQSFSKAGGFTITLFKRTSKD